MKNMPGGEGGVSAGGVSAIICWLVILFETVEYDVLVAGFRQKCVHLFQMCVADGIYGALERFL